MAAELGQFGTFIGVEVTDWKVGYARLTLPIQSFMLNRSGVLHGGIVAALLDASAGYAGTYCTVPGNVRRGVTLSMATSFLGQVGSGVIASEAHVTGGGRRIFFARAELRDAEGRLLATADCTYKYRSNSIDPAGFAPDAEDERN